jgi:hypothetical protein
MNIRVHDIVITAINNKQTKLKEIVVDIRTDDKTIITNDDCYTLDSMISINNPNKQIIRWY